MSVHKNSLSIKNCNLNIRKNKPLITIITVVFNGERFIENTILSVINQSYQNIEYIIIDGGSNDHTLDIIKKYDYGIDYWISESDEGIYDAMNKGINLATGSWINFMNAGDLFCTLDIINSINGFDDTYDIIYGDSLVYDGKANSSILVKAKNLSRFNLLFWQTRTVCHQSIFLKTNLVSNFSLNYVLKSELDQYFKYVSYRSLKLNLPICKYLIGGQSAKAFSAEAFEAFQVLFKNNRLLFWIGLPIIFYRFILSFKSSRKC